jgi:hypothetical protein
VPDLSLLGCTNIFKRDQCRPFLCTSAPAVSPALIACGSRIPPALVPLATGLLAKFGLKSDLNHHLPLCTSAIVARFPACVGLFWIDSAEVPDVAQQLIFCAPASSLPDRVREIWTPAALVPLATRLLARVGLKSDPSHDLPLRTSVAARLVVCVRLFQFDSAKLPVVAQRLVICASASDLAVCVYGSWIPSTPIPLAARLPAKFGLRSDPRYDLPLRITAAVTRLAVCVSFFQIDSAGEPDVARQFRFCASTSGVAAFVCGLWIPSALVPVALRLPVQFGLKSDPSYDLPACTSAIVTRLIAHVSSIQCDAAVEPDAAHSFNALAGKRDPRRARVFFLSV